MGSESFSDELRNKDVLIVGTGPSWVDFPFNQFRKAGCIIFVINHIARLIQPDYILCLERWPMDELIRYGFNPYMGTMPIKPDYIEKWGGPETSGTEWAGIRTICGSSAGLQSKGMVRVVPPSKRPSIDLEKGFFSNISTGVYATSAALSMGAKHIFLIGHDGPVVGMKGDEKRGIPTYPKVNDTLHGVDDPEFRRLPRGVAMQYSLMQPAWDLMGQYQNIWNLSPISLIQAFPRITTEKALQIIGDTV